MVLVGYLHGDVLGVLRRQLQLDRRRVQDLHVSQVDGQIAEGLWSDLVVAQGDVAQGDRATGVPERGRYQWNVKTNSTRKGNDW